MATAPETLVDLADELPFLPKRFQISSPSDPLQIIRENLPADPVVQTPFGRRRMTYADYTASGRPLAIIERFIHDLVSPWYANTHTEMSASGLQSTHFREEARNIVALSVGADRSLYDVIFVGSGVTGAINKLISLLGIHIPQALRQFARVPKENRPLIMITEHEHHSNELMWRETVADVLPIAHNVDGGLDMALLETELQNAQKDGRRLILGSFSAGSNVTGLRLDTQAIAAMMHKYGAFCCFDFAGAGPYADIGMMGSPTIPDSYMDGIYISPHKFVGGPGTPGVLILRKSFVEATGALNRNPTIAGGGTVTMVWPDPEHPSVTCATYEHQLTAREEAGTPAIVESIRCGLVFHLKSLVGPKLIEKLEGDYAQRAILRLSSNPNIWVMGSQWKNIASEHRLSITSFNILTNLPHRQATDAHGRSLLLHPHFVAALLNDVYGIQARSGCSCCGPLGFRLFAHKPAEVSDLVLLAHEQGIHCTKPGWARVNFNYFITNEEFEYILAAIEQIATHGWRLLPLYCICLKTGMYWYNGIKDGTPFDRLSSLRSLKEFSLVQGSWKPVERSVDNRQDYLGEALKLYENAPALVREMLFRFRDTRRKDVDFPLHLQRLRWFPLGSEVLPALGISAEELQGARDSASSKSKMLNPVAVAAPDDENRSLHPDLTFHRPKG